MIQNLYEDWLREVKPNKAIDIEKPADIIEKSKTTEFSNELPGGIYQISFEYNTAAEATVTKNAQQMDNYTRTWRLVSNYPEVDGALEEIINEAIVIDTDDNIVKIDLSKIDEKILSENLKTKISDVFPDILDLLQFNKMGQEIFETWYIDGRLDYEIVLLKEASKEGILKVNRLDPLNIKKVLEKADRLEFKIKASEEYWIYTDPVKQTRWKVHPDLVVHIGSGRTDKVTGLEVSYLHKALKAINNLRLIEDAIVIYRISRAPERRVFSIDTGNLPKAKAEEFIRGLINKYQNKVTYDNVTGTITNKKNVMAMIEDFWIGRSANGQGSSISTLQGGHNLGELDDLYYFVLKVYKALKVPETRREVREKGILPVGQTSQIERDEIKFAKHIYKVRRQFSTLFTEILGRQLLLKKIIEKETWDKIKDKILYVFNNDNYYEEIKETEMLNMRLQLADRMRDYVGTYFTEDDIALKVFKYTEEEWGEKKKECEKLKKKKEEEAAKLGTTLPGSDLNPNPNLNPNLGKPPIGGAKNGLPPEEEI